MDKIIQSGFMDEESRLLRVLPPKKSLKDIKIILDGGDIPSTIEIPSNIPSIIDFPFPDIKVDWLPRPQLGLTVTVNIPETWEEKIKSKKYRSIDDPFEVSNLEEMI